MTNPSAPAAWYPDPAGRHQHRYWDGSLWTEYVATDGAQSIDPLGVAPLTRRAARQQAAQETVASNTRTTFTERRAAARAERERLREEREMVTRQREALRQREQLEELARKAHALEESQQLARQQAEQRERIRLAELARVRAEQEAAEAAKRGAREAAARESREAQEREARVLEYPSFYLPEYNGHAGTEVAGEFARLDAIHKVLGRRPKLDEEIVRDGLLAALVPEPSNAYDRNAVKVLIDGQHVGYLEKEVAVVTQPIMRRIIEAGYLPTTGARIWAVARRDNYDARKLRHHANVRLALSYTGSMLPLNDPPFEGYSIIPWGGSLQVTGEEHHQEVLAEYVTDDPSALVIGTLTLIQRGTPKAPKELIEISIDGQRIGQLTPGSSQHFIPTVQHLERQGQTAAAWLRVSGSAIAAQVTIHATRAHELPSEWFDAPHTAPRLHGVSRPSTNDGEIDDAEIRTKMREPMWDDS
ncbi:DUF2510 domain-containing protein [Microbacterium sp. USTB-Y]|uniref:DUF2510 domain-containing protein n=1 Tax=Microbacterium sp. USTB-Y TaxID=2823692 RepID=UPI002557FEBF|nr:DUF2510 domain-containing protein [Microbacterium sp. USTB-Y]